MMIRLPCGHYEAAPAPTCQTCRMYAANAAFRTAVNRSQGLLTSDRVGINVGLCLHLREPVSAFRRRCLLGHANPDGLGGVKPCCDCGPGKCPDYAADPDGI